MSVKHACEIMKVSTSGYYEWQCGDESPRQLRDRIRAQHIKEIFHKHKRNYGARRTKRVNTTDSRHNMLISDNLLKRQFDQSMPNKAWVTDTTYIRTMEGRLYLTVIIDLYSRRVAGWAVSDKIDALSIMSGRQLLRQCLRRVFFPLVEG